MQQSTTDNTNSTATVGSGLPGTAFDNMKSHLVPATAEPKTVVSQFPPPIAQPVDRLTIEGSTPGDFRGQAQQPNPLAGNDTPPRGETGTRGA
jgi:hypothetical protein